MTNQILFETGTAYVLLIEVLRHSYALVTNFITPPLLIWNSISTYNKPDI